CVDPSDTPLSGGWAEEGLCQACARPSMLESWTVYRQPADFPDRCVARRALNGIPTLDLLQAPTLEELRAHRPAGSAVIPRMAGDVGSIVEVWLPPGGHAQGGRIPRIHAMLDSTWGMSARSSDLGLSRKRAP